MENVNVYDLAQIKSALTQVESNTKNADINLEDFIYKQSEGGVSLERKTKTSGVDEFFLSEISLKQLCSTAGVPFGFVTKNPPNLNDAILAHYYPQIERKRQQIRYIEFEGKAVIRGLIDPDMEYMPYIDVVSSLEKAFLGKGRVVNFSGGSEMDDHMHIRMIDDATQVQVESNLFSPYVDLIISDVGVGKRIQISIGMYSVTEGFSIGMANDGQPFMSIPYVLKESEGRLDAALEDALLSGRNLMVMQTNYFKEKTKAALEQEMSHFDVLEMVKSFKDFRSVSKGFATKLLKEYQGVEDDEITYTLWDVVSRIAQRSDGEARAHSVEAFAGKVMNFVA